MSQHRYQSDHDVLDRLVGSAVHELAAHARPAQLAPGAIAAGFRLRRRMRVRRAAGVALIAVALIAAIAVPSVLLHPSGPPGGLLPAETPTGAPTTEPNGVPNTEPTDASDAVPPGAVGLRKGWFVISGGREPLQVWSRDKGRYEQVTGLGVAAAPVGPYAVILVDDNSPPHLTLIDLRGRQPRPLSVTNAHSLQWSPDGTRILFTIFDKDTAKTSYTIVDAGSGQQKSIPVDTSKYFCTDSCSFTWSRDGTEVAWPLTDEAVTRTELEAHARKGIQMFSADDGRPTRMLPVRGEASGPFAWSPDGHLVVVTGPALVDGKRQRRVLLVDVATGAVRHQFDAMEGKAYFVSNDRFLLTGLGPVLLCDGAGSPVAQIELPTSFANGLIELGPPG